MFGKALIATILGASVTGGAVYVAAHPEILEPRPAQTQPNIIEDAVKTPQVDMPDPAQTDPVTVTETQVDVTPDAETALTEYENAPAESETPDETTPPIVLPEAKQLTVRTPVPTTAQEQAEEAVQKAKRLANADLNRIMDQAMRMESPDLRDQAYLSAVEFALSNDNYAGANKAMENLSQPQLRDTARSKIAVRYAQNGRSGSAFTVIDDVEIDDLRDFMRLQVIEAITRGQ